MTFRIEIKKQAKILQSFLHNEKQDIKLGSCYEAIAKINGYKNWNTMSADLEKKGHPVEIKKKPFINENVNISETALMIIANKGKSGNLDEDAIRLLLFFLYKLENNSTLINENRASFLLKSDSFHRSLSMLVEEDLIIRTNYEEYCTYEINPNFFWKGTVDNHNLAINNLCKKTMTIEAVNNLSTYEQTDIQELHSFFESNLLKKEIEFSKEKFSTPIA